MNNSNKKKVDQLGMSQGKANNILKKSIMFDLVCTLKLNICYQCSGVIDTIDEFSVEHKVPWLDSSSPQELFFDLDNISFSHLKCNIGNGRRPTKIKDINGMKWCKACQQYKKVEEFYNCDRYIRNTRCKKCDSKKSKVYRQNLKNKLLDNSISI